MKIIVVLLVGAIVLVSCNDDSSIEQLKVINRSLENSKVFVAHHTSEMYEKMKRSQNDPSYLRTMRPMMPKTDSLIRRSANLVKFIKSLKASLGDLEKDTKIVKEIFITNKKGFELYNMLADYSSHIRNQFTDEEFDNDRVKDLDLLNDYVDNENRSSMWTELHFGDASVLSAKTLLSTLENDVLITENRFVDHFYTKGTAVIVDEFTAFKTLVILSTSQVSAGEELEVNAGIGEFTTYRKPEITFDGLKARVDMDGVATYKVKANKEPGEHSIVVVFRFIDNTGATRVVTKAVRYNVMK